MNLSQSFIDAVEHLDCVNPYDGSMHHAEEKRNWAWYEGFEAGQKSVLDYLRECEVKAVCP